MYICNDNKEKEAINLRMGVYGIWEGQREDILDGFEWGKVYNSVWIINIKNLTQEM